MVDARMRHWHGVSLDLSHASALLLWTAKQLQPSTGSDDRFRLLQLLTFSVTLGHWKAGKVQPPIQFSHAQPSSFHIAKINFPGMRDERLCVVRVSDCPSRSTRHQLTWTSSSAETAPGFSPDKKRQWHADMDLQAERATSWSSDSAVPCVFSP